MGRTHIYFFDSCVKFARFISQHFPSLGLIMTLRKIRGLVSLFHPVHYHHNINLSWMDFVLSGCISWQCKSVKNALWFSKGTLAPNISKGRSKALVLNKFNRLVGMRGKAITWTRLYFCINRFYFPKKRLFHASKVKDCCFRKGCFPLKEGKIGFRY